MDKKDFTIGIVSGVILTFIGVFIQFQLNKNYELNKEIEKLDVITIKHLDNRLTKSYSILINSGSSVFKERWDYYIYNVIYPWNSNLYLIDVHIKQNHPSVYEDFEIVKNSFKEIHKLLNELRKAQNLSSKKKENELSFLENKVEKKLDSIRLIINIIKSELSR